MLADNMTTQPPNLLSSYNLQEGVLSNVVYSGKIQARLGNSGTYKEDGMASANNPSPWLEPVTAANLTHGPLRLSEALRVVHAIKEHAANTLDESEGASEEALAVLENQLLAETVADEFASELLEYCDIGNPAETHNFLESIAAWASDRRNGTTPREGV